MKYIDKILQNDCGFDVTCWVAVSGSFSLDENKGTITLLGWKDVESFQSKAAPADSKWIELELSSLQSFETVWGEIVMRLVGEGVFLNGEIKETV